MPPILPDVSRDRMIGAVNAVRERLHRAVKVLEKARIPYAVAGGNAVAAWVSRVDQGAVRNTPDVDILIRRADFPSAKSAMEDAGFHHQLVAGIDMFLDGDTTKVRDAVHLLFAAEKVREEYPLPSPDVEPADHSGGFG